MKIDENFWDLVKQGWNNTTSKNKDDIIENNVKSILKNRKNKKSRIKKEIDFIMDMEEI